MIGGQDIIIPTYGGKASLDHCVRIIHRSWPEAVFEDAETGDRTSDYSQLSFARISEMIIYREHDVMESWDRTGAEPDLTNTMIHLLINENFLTMVVDDASDAYISRLIDALKGSLQMDILNMKGRAA
ncbi:hypothetical protein BH23PLA1_BH23PLA1_23750 [soil metagenome]